MLVAEEIRDLVDVVLVLEDTNRRQQIRPSKLTQSDEATPRTVDNEENSSYHSMNVSGMKLRSLFEELEARMSVDDILHEWYEIFWSNVISSLAFVGENVQELSGFVVENSHHLTPKVRKGYVRQLACLLSSSSRK